jgi:hypothetical protein
LLKAKKIVVVLTRRFLCDDPSKERESLPLRETNCLADHYLVEMVLKAKRQWQVRQHLKRKMMETQMQSEKSELTALIE